MQLEPDGTRESAFPFDDQHPLALAYPSLARAYAHSVGRLEDHRTGLLERLSERQRSSASLLVLGMTEREIAGRLGIPQNTVHDHVKRIYNAWDVNTRVAVRDLWCARLPAFTP